MADLKLTPDTSVRFSDDGKPIEIPRPVDVPRWIKGRIEYFGIQLEFTDNERSGRCTYKKFEIEHLHNEEVRSKHEYDEYEFSLADMAPVPLGNRHYRAEPEEEKITGHLELVSAGGLLIIHRKHANLGTQEQWLRKFFNDKKRPPVPEKMNRHSDRATRATPAVACTSKYETLSITSSGISGKQAIARVTPERPRPRSRASSFNIT